MVGDGARDVVAKPNGQVRIINAHVMEALLHIPLEAGRHLRRLEDGWLARARVGEHLRSELAPRGLHMLVVS